MQRFCFIAVLLSTFACRDLEQVQQQPAPSVSSAPRDGGTLMRRIENDVSTLNYLLQTTEYERYVLSYLYDPLIELDENLQPIPGTAARWEVSPDARTWTLHLDPRATFSDGRPVHASDVVFTLRKIVEAESMQFSGFFEGLDLDQTRALDERTVRVVFSKPLAGRWYAFNIGVLPEHVYGAGDFVKDFNDVALGNGAYKLAARERGKSITLERRGDYWRAKPHIERIVFKVIGDASVAWNAMKRGDIDEMRVKSDLYQVQKNDPAVKARMKFHDIWPLSYNCIGWNARDPILRDARVRRALAMAIDVPQIVRTIYHGDARALSGPFTPDQESYDHAVKPVAFDLAGAARLLDEAGFPDRGGKRMTLEMLVPAGNTAGVEQSQILQGTLRTIGVGLEIRQLEGAAFFDHVMRGNYQAAFFGWGLDPEPDLYALFHSKQIPPAGMNVVRYENPEADRLIDAARAELDRAKRNELYRRLHALLAADQPYAWTVQYAQKWAVNERVHGVRASKGFGLFLWSPGPQGWWVEDR